MTKKEAINKLNWALDNNSIEDVQSAYDYIIALKMAIKALEQEPTTKNDLAVDCISRADAIKAMQDKAKKLTNEDTINGLCGAVAILFDLPPVTPQEPRKGKWLSRWHAGHDLHFHVCSECNEEFSCDMETGISIDNYRYCPNCGAKMEVEE